MVISILSGWRVIPIKSYESQEQNGIKYLAHHSLIFNKTPIVFLIVNITDSVHECQIVSCMLNCQCLDESMNAI